MQKSFSTQIDLFITNADLDYPIVHSLDDTEALLYWKEIEALLSPIYGSKTGRPAFELISRFAPRCVVSTIGRTARAVFVTRFVVSKVLSA